MVVSMTAMPHILLPVATAEGQPHIRVCKNVFGVFLHSKKTKRRFDVQKYIFARQILQIYLMPKCILATRTFSKGKCLAYILQRKMFSVHFANISFLQNKKHMVALPQL